MVLPVPEGEEASSSSSDDLPPPGADQATTHRASPGAAAKLSATMSGPSRVRYSPAAMPLDTVMAVPCQAAVACLQALLEARHPKHSALRPICCQNCLVPELCLTMSALAGVCACSLPSHTMQDRLHIHVTPTWHTLWWEYLVVMLRMGCSPPSPPLTSRVCCTGRRGRRRKSEDDVIPLALTGLSPLTWPKIGGKPTA